MNRFELLPPIQIIKPRYDVMLLLASVALLMIGYIMVTSASLHLGVKESGNIFHYPGRQSGHIGVG